MRKLGLISLNLLLVALVLSWLTRVPPATAANITCNAPTTLRDSIQETASEPQCYRFSVPRDSNFLQIELEPNSGAFDLYFKASLATSLSDADKVNLTGLTGQVTYALLAPQSGTYTIAVVPTGNSGRFRLTAVVSSTAKSAGDQPHQSCSAGTCRASYPISTSGNGVSFGSNSGDQIIFPIKIGSPGRVEVHTTWTGATSNLTLHLAGSDLSPYETTTGSNPLTLTYDVTQADFDRGSELQVHLIHSGRNGDSVAGQVEISYPR